MFERETRKPRLRLLRSRSSPPPQPALRPAAAARNPPPVAKRQARTPRESESWT